MRVESGRPCQNGGWLHSLDSGPHPRPPLPQKPTSPLANAGALMQEFSAETWPEMQEQFAASLGVNVAGLRAIGCAYAIGHRAWAFPMKDADGNIIGIRLRSESGHKWAVKGSRAGLFYAEGEAPEAVICEGPTDTAAAITIGLHAIGRPSCLGCEAELVRLLKRKGCHRAIIVSDNDEPGWRGAEKLSRELPIPNVLLTLPCKDMRDFTNLGGTSVLLHSLSQNLVWNQACCMAKIVPKQVETCQAQNIDQLRRAAG